MDYVCYLIGISEFIETNQLFLQNWTSTAHLCNRIEKLRKGRVDYLSLRETHLSLVLSWELKRWNAVVHDFPDALHLPENVISSICVMDRSGSWGNTCDREAASLVKATNKCQPQERVRTEHKQSKWRAKIPKRRFRISLSDNWRISAAKSRNNEGLGRAPRPHGAFFSLLSSLRASIPSHFCRRRQPSTGIRAFWKINLVTTLDTMLVFYDDFYETSLYYFEIMSGVGGWTVIVSMKFDIKAES